MIYGSYKIDIELFGLSIFVHMIKDVPERGRGRCPKWLIKSARKMAGTGLATYHTDDVCRFYILLKDASFSALSHEAVHIANYICETRGIGTSQTNDEVVAYIVGLITEYHEYAMKTTFKGKRK